MIFGKRVERAMELAKEKRKQREADLPEGKDDIQLEKGDLFALTMSAFGVILPVALVVLLALAAVGYFFIFR